MTVIQLLSQIFFTLILRSN